MKKRIFAFLTIFALCLALRPLAVQATETEDTETTEASAKTLTVNASASGDTEGSVYTTIQKAIDYIYELDDTTGDENAKENWTITIQPGTYDQFAVLPGLDGLTVQAAEGASVIVNTWTGVDNASARALYPSGAEFKDSFNSILICANNVTIDGLIVNVGDTGIKSDGSDTESAPWYASGITDLGTNYIPKYRSEYDGLTVSNCQFTTTVGACSGVLLASSEKWTVSNCSFDGFDIAVYMLGDNNVAENVSITNNTFKNCEQAAYIYYGGTPSDSASYSMTFSGNTLVGTSGKYCMATFVDLNGNNGSIDNLSITNNVLNYSVLALVDVGGDKMSLFDTNNTFDKYSFYVYSEDETGSTDKSGKDFTFTYVSQGEGYWVFDSTAFKKLNKLTSSSKASSAIASAITAANKSENVNTLTVTVSLTSYAKTFLEPKSSGSRPARSRNRDWIR